MTNVGLTDVLPVWLSSTPSAPRDGHDATDGALDSALSGGDASMVGGGGLGLSSSQIGSLQSSTGFSAIALALFVTYRIINAVGPVLTFGISLVANAFAAVAPPLISVLPQPPPPPLATAFVLASYALVAASRNMMFATAIMLSKESAAGAPGVAIGINQSACSLGAALGPALSGLVYTTSLRVLRSASPFFLLLAFVGAFPMGGLYQVCVPPWPWNVPRLPQQK